MYAEALGAHELPLELPAGATAGDALADVRRRAGAEHLPPKPLIAVNQRYAKPETVLKAGETLRIARWNGAAAERAA